jgi:hypothetical protein
MKYVIEALLFILLVILILVLYKYKYATTSPSVPFIDVPHADRPPGRVTIVSITPTKNPGLIISFLPPQDTGVYKSTIYKNFKFYLHYDTTDTSNNYIDIGHYIVEPGINSPDGLVKWMNGTIGEPGMPSQVKFEKNVISDLSKDISNGNVSFPTPDTLFKVSVVAVNTADFESEQTWSTQTVKYDKCQDDPSACWASSEPGTWMPKVDSPSQQVQLGALCTYPQNPSVVGTWSNASSDPQFAEC